MFRFICYSFCICRGVGRDENMYDHNYQAEVAIARTPNVPPHCPSDRRSVPPVYVRTASPIALGGTYRRKTLMATEHAPTPRVPYVYSE